MSAKILVVMGSDSDFPVMKAAVQVLEEFGVPFSVRVCSAHRTPEASHELATSAEERGYKLIIAGAGMAAHLAGAFAAWSPLPVVGVPIEAGSLRGLDSLYSTSQMPPGVPVATMGIGKAGAKNAALFAIQVLALSDPDLAAALKRYKQQMADDVIEKDQRLQAELKERLE